MRFSGGLHKIVVVEVLPVWGFVAEFWFKTRSMMVVQMNRGFSKVGALWANLSVVQNADTHYVRDNPKKDGKNHQSNQHSNIIKKSILV